MVREDMRILLLSTSVMPVGTGRYGGIELLVTRFSTALLRAGQQVDIAAPEGSVVPEGARLIETVSLPDEQDRDDVAIGEIAAAVSAAVSKSGQFFDVLHDFSHKQFLGKGATGEAAQIPAIFMLWDPVYFKYDKSLYNIVCLSDWQARRFETMYKRQSIVLPNGCIDPTVYKPNGPRNNRFLFLGKLSPSKGPDKAIEFCKKNGFELDVVGGHVPTERVSEAHYFEFLKQEAGTGEQIQIHYNVTEEEKIRFLQTCRALIYPVQQDEAHWLAGVEAWFCGAPTITYDRGAMDEISPYYVAKNDEQFLDLMENVDSFGPPVAEKVRENAIQKYGADAVARKYMAVYEEVIRGARW